MRDMRDKVEAHGAFARVFVLGKRWAWDSQVLQSSGACCVSEEANGFYCTATSAKPLRAAQAEGYKVFGWLVWSVWLAGWLVGFVGWSGLVCLFGLVGWKEAPHRLRPSLGIGGSAVAVR